MTEPTPATPTTETETVNPQRRPLFRVTKGEHKGRQVIFLEAAGVERRQTLARVQDERDGQEFTLRADSLERTFRTREEQELGRDFTSDEATAWERNRDLKIWEFLEAQRRTEITEALTAMAGRLERAAAELRQGVASGRSPASLACDAQHDLTWLFPNLGTDRLTRQALEWTQASAELDRLRQSLA